MSVEASFVTLDDFDDDDWDDMEENEEETDLSSSQRRIVLVNAKDVANFQNSPIEGSHIQKEHSREQTQNLLQDHSTHLCSESYLFTNFWWWVVVLIAFILTLYIVMHMYIRARQIRQQWASVGIKSY